MSTEKALSPGSLVLVTGTTGFIGSHIADQIIEAGFRVKGAVRSEEKGEWISKFFNDRHKPIDGSPAFEYIVVPEMEAANAYDDAITGVSGVVHTASVLTFSPNPHEVIPQSVAGATNILRAAVAAPQVRRFVLTSSSLAAVMPNPNTKFEFGPQTWNRDAKDKAWAPPPYTQDRGFTVYCQSKVESEEACWKIVKDELKRNDFVFNAVLPNFNIGEILHPNIAGGPSGGMVKGVWEGDERTIEFMKALIEPQYYVPVLDTAKLHVIALTERSVQSERLMGFANTFNVNDLIDAMGRIDPNRKLPERIENASQDLSIVDNKRTVDLLKKVYRKQGWDGFEESIRRNVGVA